MDPLADLTAREGVASAMASARDGIDVLLRDRGLRKTTPDVAAESLLRGAWASAVLAGTTSDEDAFRDGRGDPVAQASLRLSTHVLGLTGVLTRSPLQALARLHAVAAADEPPDTVGRPRDADSARRLADVAALLSRPTTAPGLVVAAVVHAEILSAQPFATHNGLVARAVERLILLERGVDRLGATVPEAGHLAGRPAYEARAAAYAEASASGDPRRGLAAAHAWLLYAAEAYAAGADHSPLLR
ncbi:oxidoreductase [Nocardioides sp. HDW12B]|uniref:oxidoreductase n=1 Tax=Nocardioides sp. HDW12B TaxID=2714939 RepID=UPI0014091754|nr:oxidoreductase [Nocardioides sp. HDW12B]QIK67636.1 oxidoreductase [Nocardioides sp. HDW12B]